MTGGATVERTPTVISGFDDIALGGLPTGRSTLVTGTTGSGKTLFAAEYNHITRQGIEEFVFDNVMILRNVMQNERRRRTIEIVKFRGTTHRTGEWLFTIDPKDGLVIIPIAFLAPRDRASQERVSTGNIELDAMVGGGVFRDAVVLLIGPSGGGKTLSAPQFADAAFRAGERCLFHAFDETREQLSRNAAGWGMDLDVMEASGLLRVTATYPEVASVEDHFLRIRRDIADFAPARLIIDSLSALERRAAPRTLLDFVIALGGVVLQHEITALFTSAPVGEGTPMFTAPIAKIASITDVTILLRYVEGARAVQRAIAVLQTRGSAHDNTIRQVAIDGRGMHIGDPYPEAFYMLPGAAVLLRHPQWLTGPDRATAGDQDES